MGEIYVPCQFFDASAPLGSFFRKKFFSYGIGECVCTKLCLVMGSNANTRTNQAKKENTLRLRHVDFDKAIIKIGGHHCDMASFSSSCS